MVLLDSNEAVAGISFFLVAVSLFDVRVNNVGGTALVEVDFGEGVTLAEVEVDDGTAGVAETLVLEEVELYR